MSKKKLFNKKIFLTSFIVILNIFLISFILILKNSDPFPKRIPRITITAAEGKTYNLDCHHAKLVCLIKIDDEEIIQSLLTSLAFIVENIADILDIVVFSPCPEKFMESALNSSNIINAQYDEFTIMRTQSDPHFFLYDKNGSLLIDRQLSDNPEEMVWLISDFIGINLLNWIPTEIVDVNKNISTNSYLRFIEKYSENSFAKINVFIFFDDACSSCLSGQIINDINKFQMKNLNIKYYIVLPSSYKTNDLRNIKRNNNFSLDFIKIGKEIEHYKQLRMQTDFISTTNGVALVSNDKGNVLFLVDFFNEKNQYRVNNYNSLKNFLHSEKN